MFQQAGTAQLNDYFRPLSERGGSRVFFCRIAGYGETVAAFLRRYYEAARRAHPQPHARQPVLFQ